MKKKIIINICIVFLLIICIYSSFKVYQKYHTKKEIEEVNNIKLVPDKNIVDSLREQYNNEDILGILKIAGIDTILVQGKDNDYYLNHLVNREENKTGSVFVDYRQNIKTAKQLNIFGHSSDYYNLPFNTLLNYLDINFYKDNQIAEIITIGETYKYEIFGVKKTTDEEHLIFDFKNSDEFINHLKILQDDQLYDTNVKVEENDDILIIQTCINDDKKGDLLVIYLRKVG